MACHYIQGGKGLPGSSGPYGLQVRFAMLVYKTYNKTLKTKFTTYITLNKKQEKKQDNNSNINASQD
jgi:hypothetical protein